ncbi:hypothetical protein [Nocardioides houyundeii]|uniref:hypothetical protein n=1 Tax=Nocardioides houyundeii TaxID=2045452 RepID=UPI0013B3C823|nr:hypothetical protein [Nocardioides houyundeii]
MDTGTASSKAGRTPAKTGGPWLMYALCCAVPPTLLNGLVVGYGSLWFLIGGSTPDAGDYALSTGGYAAAALVLALAVPALLGHGGSGWLIAIATVCAPLLTVLALTSAVSWFRTPTPHAYWTFWDGVGAVLWGPWTWLLLAVGVRQIWVRWKFA